MRPKSVALAEALYGASIVLVLIGAAMTWAAASARFGAGLAIGTTIFAVAVPLLLLFWTTRGRSRVAFWLLTAWTAFSVWSVARQVIAGTHVGLIGAITIAQVILMVLALVLLSGPDARGWLAGRAMTGDAEA